MLDLLSALVLDKHLNKEVIVFQKLLDAFTVFGYKDLEMPKSKKNFNFANLDVKAIRIMNRLTKYVDNFNIDTS